MPFAGYKDFKTCLIDQQKKGHSLEVASKICGSLQAEAEKMNKIDKYIPILKVDDEQRMVYGYASTPDLDSQGEKVDIGAIERALPEYLKFPTIREMHTSNAVGTTKETTIDAKGLFIGVKIVDDNTWKKVKEGVFRGFSIGGKILNKVGNTIRDLVLTEISIVDVPANKNAVITLFKNDVNYIPKFVQEHEQLHSFYVKGVRSMEEQGVKEVLDENTVVEETPKTDDVEPIIEDDNKKEVEAETVETEVTEEKTDEVTEVETVSEQPEMVEEVKEVSDNAFDLTKFDNFAKAEDLVKINDSLLKVASALEKLEDRLGKLEKTAMPSKTSTSYVVEKTLGGTVNTVNTVEYDTAKKEFAELMKIRETNPERYALEKLYDRAFQLNDKYHFI